MKDLQNGFGELWLLLRRRPAEDRPWRDFWVVWIAAFVPFVVALLIVDPPALSLTMLIVIVGGLVWLVLARKALTYLGVVGDRTPR